MPLSIAKEQSIRALIDSGADISIIKCSSLKRHSIINKNEAIAISGFTNNSICTLGTCIGILELNKKSIEQKFHVVSKAVKLNNVDAILGKNFLFNNNIIVDFGKGVLYSNTENIKIISSKKSNKNISISTPKQNTKPDACKMNICASSPDVFKSNVYAHDPFKTNIYASLPIEDDNIETTSCEPAKSFINRVAQKQIVDELQEKGFKVLLGCSNNTFYCSNSDDLLEVNAGNVTKSESESKTQSKEKKTFSAQAPRTNFFSKKHSVFTLHKQGNTLQNEITQNACGSNKKSNELRDTACSGRRSRPNDSLSQLRFYCSSKLTTCNVNEYNFEECLKTLYTHTSRFSGCVEKGTQFNTIISTLNVYNLVILELKKFLVKNRDYNDFEQYLINIGKVTYDFSNLPKPVFTVKQILGYLCLLRKQIITMNKMFRNQKLNINNALTKKEKNNEIFKALAEIFKRKEHITLPARTERVISIILEEDEEQLCLSTEIMKGVYVGNCLIKPSNNIGVISVLNTRNTDVYINEIYLDLLPLNEFQILSISSDTKSEDRIVTLLNKVDCSHLNNEETESLRDILIEYNSVFYLEGDILSHTDTITHRIEINEGIKPINTKPYRLAMSQREEIGKQVEKMLKENIIRPSNSAWNSPLLVVTKKLPNNKIKHRVVVDYRQLNNVTIGDAYPVLDLSDILSQVGNAAYFSVLDLASGFHQILIDPRDRYLTAFSTGTSSHPNPCLGNQFEFNRMPFGLKNAPATFNRLMRTVMSGLQGISCLVYMDDIVVFAHTLAEHNMKLKQVLDRLIGHNLKLQPEKCKFLRKEVVYLGHLISQDGIRPDPNKTAAVSGFPRPKNQKGVRSFLGLISFYRRMVDHFGSLSKPLTSLLKKDSTFQWTEQCEEAFNLLKNAVISSPILQHPNFKERFILTTDASAYAISGVLSQGELGSDLPIAFISRTLQPAETRYSTTEREMLAIFWSIKQLRHYLLGYFFIVVTDHRPLQYIFRVKDSFSRLFRWRLQLSDYDFVVVYKPGKSNNVADALSRYVPECNVVTRSAKRKETQIESQCETNRPTDISQPINAEYKHLLLNKNFENCLNFISKYNVTENCINEANISQMNKNESQLFLVTPDSVLLMQNEIIKLNDSIYLLKENNFTFYLTVKNSSRNELEFDKFYEIMTNFKVVLSEHKLDSISFIKNENSCANIDFIKMKQILRYIFSDFNFKFNIYIDERIYLNDQNDIKKVIKETHDSLIGGHIGIRRSILKLKSIYFWKNMKSDIKNYIRNCEQCQKNKITRKTKMPMVITTTSKKPFDRISLDVVGPLPITEKNNSYILTCQDDLTRYVVAMCLEDQTAETIARAFTKHIVLKFGCPISILTDNGTNFVSDLMKRVCKLLQIKKYHTTAYHPESNGSLERSHRVLKEYLRNYVNKNLNNWDEFIQYGVFVYNTSPHSSTGFTPHELLFGEKANIPSSLTKNLTPVYNYDDYYFELKYKLQNAHEFARRNLIASKENTKKYYDKHTNDFSLKIGDKVLLESATNKKLESRYEGPYEILDFPSDVNTAIRVKNKQQIVHNNRLKPFHE